MSPGPEDASPDAPARQDAGAVGIEVHRAGRGIDWLRQGASLLRREPFLLTATLAGGFALLFLLSAIPWLGNALAPLVAPFAWLGMLAACASTEAGRRPGAADYVTASRDPRVRVELLRIGLVNLGGAIVILAAFDLLAPAAPLAEGDFPGPEYLPAFAVCAALSLPLLMAMWFAPVLVAWNGMRAGKAMFFSFFACWRNAASLTVFSLAIGAVLVVLSMALAILASALGLGNVAIQVLFAPLPLFLLALQQASTLRIYREVVRASAPLTEPDRSAPPPAGAP